LYLYIYIYIYIYIYLYSSKMIATKQIGKNRKKLDSEHNIENTVMMMTMMMTSDRCNYIRQPHSVDNTCGVTK